MSRWPAFVVVIALYSIAGDFVDTETGDEYFSRMVGKGKAVDFPLILRNDNGSSAHIISMDRMPTANLAQFFPEHDAFRLTVGNDLAHGFYYYALIVSSNNIPVCLKTDRDVACFLSDKRMNVLRANDAQRLICLFADLRSYSIVDRLPKTIDTNHIESLTYSFNNTNSAVCDVRERTRDWIVSCYMLTCPPPFLSSYKYYTFTVFKPPSCGISFESTNIIIRGHERVGL